MPQAERPGKSYQHLVWFDSKLPAPWLSLPSRTKIVGIDPIGIHPNAICRDTSPCQFRSERLGNHNDPRSASQTHFLAQPDPTPERCRVPVICDPPFRTVVFKNQRHLQAAREQRSGYRKTAMPLIERPWSRRCQILLHASGKRRGCRKAWLLPRRSKGGHRDRQSRSRKHPVPNECR